MELSSLPFVGQGLAPSRVTVSPTVQKEYREFMANFTDSVDRLRGGVKPHSARYQTTLSENAAKSS